MFSNDDTHPAAINAAKYCIQQVEKCDTLGGNTSTLHILTLLKDIIGTFPKNYIKVKMEMIIVEIFVCFIIIFKSVSFQSTCEMVLKLMTLGTPLTVTCCLEVLHGLFTSQTSSNRLTPVLNGQILNALYDYQPSTNDCQATLAWLTVMQEAHKALVR